MGSQMLAKFEKSHLDENDLNKIYLFPTKNESTMYIDAYCNGSGTQFTNGAPLLKYGAAAFVSVFYAFYF